MAEDGKAQEPGRLAHQQLDEAACRELIRQAGDVLARERVLSVQDACRCLYELAQARKLLLAEVALAILSVGETWAGHRAA